MPQPPLLRRFDRRIVTMAICMAVSLWLAWYLRQPDPEYSSERRSAGLEATDVTDVDDDAFIVDTFDWLVNETIFNADQEDERGKRVAYSDEFTSGLSRWRLRLYPEGHLNDGTHWSIGVESLDAPRYQKGWYRLLVGGVTLHSRADTQPERRAMFEAVVGREPLSSVNAPFGYAMVMVDQPYFVIQNFATHDKIYGMPEFVDDQGYFRLEARLMIAAELGDLAKDQLEASLDPASGAAPVDTQQPWKDKAWMERRFKRSVRKGYPRM